MKIKDKISEKYLEEVNRLSNGHPDSPGVASLQQEEMDKIWKEISDELDIEEIWSKISSDLDVITPPDHNRRILFKGCAILLLLVAGLIPVKKAIPDTGFSRPEIPVKINPEKKLTGHVSADEAADPWLSTGTRWYPTVGSLQEPHAIQQASIISPAEKHERVADIPVTGQPENKEIIGISITSVTDAKKLSVSPEEASVSRPDILPVMASAAPGEKEMALSIDPDLLKAERPPATAGRLPPSSDIRRFSGGLVTSFKNTWLLNQETFNGLRSESLNTTEIVVFPDAGLSLGYSLTGKWLLQADAFLYSNTGQEYYEYIYGHYSKKRIVLRYSTVALSVKYKTGRKASYANRSSINILAGCYLSFLHSADQKINADIERIKSDYRNGDLGVRLGSELELNLGNNLSVAPGLALTLGITNICRDDGEMPAYLRRTHNGSVVLQLSFYYHFD